MVFLWARFHDCGETIQKIVQNSKSKFSGSTGKYELGTTEILALPIAATKRINRRCTQINLALPMAAKKR